MRFTLAAAALLATDTTPSVTVSASLALSNHHEWVHNKHNINVQERRRQLASAPQVKDFIKNKSKNKSKRGERKVRTWAQQARIQQLLQDNDMEECDPSVVDTGILSSSVCGVGKYCLESSSWVGDDGDSGVKGVCVDASSPLLERHLQSLDTGNRTSLVDDMVDLCYGNVTANDDTVSCECTGVDAESYQGSLTCSYQTTCGDLTNICQANVTFCYSLTYDLQVTAQYEGSGNLCYNFTSPDPFNYCYAVTYEGSPEPEECGMVFSDTQCDECLFTTADYNGAVTDCIAFDCENTDLGLAATLCDYTVIELVIADYLLYNALPCPNGCNLCGPNGYMTDTYNNITLPTGEAYACGLLEIAALAGYFDGIQPDLCELLPSLVDVPCGCAQGEGDVNATDTTPPPSDPTDPSSTTVAPTVAAVDGPTTPAPVPAPTTPPPTEEGIEYSDNAGATTFTFATNSMMGMTVITAALGWFFAQ